MSFHNYSLSGILFPILLTLRHNTYSVFLAVSAVMGLSIAPLPAVTSGVITSILGADKLNDAFGEDKVYTNMIMMSVKICNLYSAQGCWHSWEVSLPSLVLQSLDTWRTIAETSRCHTIWLQVNCNISKNLRFYIWISAVLFGASAVVISGSLIVFKRRQRIRNEYQEFWKELA